MCRYLDVSFKDFNSISYYVLPKPFANQVHAIPEFRKFSDSFPNQRVEILGPMVRLDDAASPQPKGIGWVVYESMSCLQSDNGIKEST